MIQNWMILKSVGTKNKTKINYFQSIVYFL